MGIVNDPNAPFVSDDGIVNKLMGCALEYDLEIMIVGQDCDMTSDLMKRIQELDRFTIVKQCVAAPIKTRNHVNGEGPRGRWGRLL